MYFFSVFLFFLIEVLHHVNANPDPMVTPAPIHATPENVHLILARGQALQQRASSSYTWNTDGMNYCYGEPSICGQSNNLYKKCETYDSTGDYTKYFECLCTSGYVAAEIACYWCNLAFGMPDFIDEDLPSICITSLSTTIAPIPSSVLAIMSSLNATFAGTLPTGLGSGYAGITAITDSNIAGAGPGPTSGPASSPASTTSAPVTAVKTGKSSAPSINTDTWFGLSTGGETSVVTLNGVGSGETETTAPPLVTQTGVIQTPGSSSVPKVGASTGGSRGWDTSFAAILSLVLFVLMVARAL